MSLFAAAFASAFSFCAWTIATVSTTFASCLLATSNLLGLGLGARAAATLTRSATTLRSITSAITGGLISTWNLLDIGFATIGARTSPRGTWAISRNRTTLTGCLLGTRNLLGRFLLLDVCQTTSLGVDILNLTRGLGVEVDKLLTGWSTSSLFIIGSQTGKNRVCLLSDTIRLINTLGLLGSMVLAIEVVQGGEEAARDTMLLVKVDGTLSSIISNGVTMGKIFRNDAASWLLLLGNVVAVTLFVLCIMASIIIVGSRCTCNLDLRRAELSVVE